MAKDLEKLSGPLRTRVRLAADRDMSVADEVARRASVHDVKSREPKHYKESGGKR